MAYLILVRHGESEWNAKGLWTGLTDVPLSKKGQEESRRAAEKIKKLNLPIDIAYTSPLLRAKQTLREIKKVLGKTDLQTFESTVLNERDYGNYTGKNKWEVKSKVGEEEFLKIRRGWNHPIPNGETLKQVYERVVPYFEQEILPKLCEGKSVLISGHGNSLRALVKYLEKIADEDISNLEISTGEIYVYEVGPKGKITKKELPPE